MIKIYGLAISSCTRRVALVLQEKGVPYDLIQLSPENFKSEEHRKRQPFSQIPVLDDEGYQLYESRAIARYIAAKYHDQGTAGLCPSPGDYRAIGLFERACSMEYSQFYPIVERLIKEDIIIRLRGGSSDGNVTQVLKSRLEEKLDVYNAILSEQKYFAGSSITLADLFHIPELDLINKHYGYIISSRAHVNRWWMDLSVRESWKAVSQ